MLIGYPRTSTIKQEAGLLARRRDVSDRGCGEIFVELVSPVQRYFCSEFDLHRDDK
jgi:hypothetical protein